MSFTPPMSLRTGGTQTPSQSSSSVHPHRNPTNGSQSSAEKNGVQYKVLSQQEMKDVQERILMYDKLYKGTTDPFQKQMLKYQYKTELCREMGSNLERSRRDNRYLQDKLSRKSRELQGSEKKLKETREQLDNKMRDINRFWSERSEFQGQITSLQGELAQSEVNQTQLKRKLEETEKEKDDEIRMLREELGSLKRELEEVSVKKRKTEESIEKFFNDVNVK